MRLLFISLLLLLFLTSVSVAQHLVCYHCMSRLSTEGSTKQEQNMMKVGLFNRFNVPPSDEHCAVGGDGMLFRAVPKEKCESANDTCVRIILTGDDTKKLVLRGCQSTIYKPQFEMVTNYSCNSSQASECISTCSTTLCNTSKLSPFSFLSLAFTLMSVFQ